jgi:hypothetical protein
VECRKNRTQLVVQEPTMIRCECGCPYVCRATGRPARICCDQRIAIRIMCPQLRWPAQRRLNSWGGFQPCIPKLSQNRPKCVGGSVFIVFPTVIHVARMNVILKRACHADERPAGGWMSTVVENAAWILWRFGQEFTYAIEELDRCRLFVPILCN